MLALLIGLCGAAVAVAATRLVYFAEDVFARLPLHWMWWPAIGGVMIGLGGLIQPRALGVGYDVINALLTGRATLSLIVGILIVKTLIWSLSLGSGTSGGVLAPVFMIGVRSGPLSDKGFRKSSRDSGRSWAWLPWSAAFWAPHSPESCSPLN
jgi:chloride channel protein, CIC family